MKSKKNTGSYYTPAVLSEFMMNYISSYLHNVPSLTILEPSVGDGSFVKAFNNTRFSEKIKRFSFTAIDKVMPELRKAEIISTINKKKHTKYSFSKVDFLKYQITVNRKFSLVVGNPPYIKKTLLSKSQIDICGEIHNSAKLSDLSVKNIWSAFLVRCTQLLDDEGILSFVLPAELLQVKFAAELRSFLKNQFQRTEIFTFDDLLFDCKGQDTVLLFGFKKHSKPGQYYTHIENPIDLVNRNFKLSQNVGLASTDAKWSHHLLSSDELTFIHKLGNDLKKINDYCDSKPGIVTAANNFFIIDEKTEKEFNLGRHVKPIIQKGFFVNGSVVFGQDDFENLVNQGKPTKILCFNNNDSHRLNQKTIEYLSIGTDKKLNERYKCKLRKNWYVIPNISTVPQGFFFKRSHHYPKLLKNNAEVLVTDSAYKIEMKDGYKINHLIYSFYNSLTLTFAELNGRYYGGGVLELTPSEFKSLPVPNITINSSDFNNYTRVFENKSEILDILNVNDYHILNSSLNLSSEEISTVKSICKKLIDKRLRKKT